MEEKRIYPNSGALFDPPANKSSLYEGKMVGEGNLSCTCHKCGVNTEFFVDLVIKDTRKDGSAIENPFKRLILKQKNNQSDAVIAEAQPTHQTSMDTRPGARPAADPQKPLDDEIPF